MTFNWVAALVGFLALPFVALVIMGIQKLDRYCFDKKKEYVMFIFPMIIFAIILGVNGDRIPCFQ